MTSLQGLWRIICIAESSCKYFFWAPASSGYALLSFTKSLLQGTLCIEVYSNHTAHKGISPSPFSTPVGNISWSNLRARLRLEEHMSHSATRQSSTIPDDLLSYPSLHLFAFASYARSIAGLVQPFLLSSFSLYHSSF